jgi:uncharacterized delta-60 repeat protein
MNKNIVLFWVVTITKLGFPQPAIVWVDEYDSGFNDYAQAVAIDSGNNIIVTGTFYNGNDFDFLTIKYNSSGDTIWLRSYDSGGSDIARDVTVDAYGNIIVVGSSRMDSIYDCLIVKYDCDGTVVWVQRYSNGLNNFCWAVDVDMSQNYVVTGYGYNGYNNDYLTIKYADSGDTLWSRRYDAGLNDLGADVAVDSANSIIVTGSSYSFADTTYRYLTIKYDAQGETLWVRPFLSPYYLDNHAYSIAVDAVNNIIVAGKPGLFPLIIKYNPAGDTLWTSYIPQVGVSVTEPYDVTVDSSNNIIVIFNHVETGSDHDYLVIKMSPAGDIVWTTAFRQGEDGWDAYPYGVAVDTAGDIIVTGFEHDGSTFNWVTVKYTEGSGIEEEIACAGAEICELYEPFPNPFVSQTRVGYLCANPRDMRINIFDVDGRLVRNLFDQNTLAGTMTLVWNGSDDSGRKLPSGVYFVRLETANCSITKKIVKLK